MVTEIASFAVTAGTGPQFEAAVTQLREIFARAKGCKGVELLRGLETPDSYRLLVFWDTRENNTVDFRQSADYKDVGRAIRNFLAGKPTAEHYESAVKLL